MSRVPQDDIDESRISLCRPKDRATTRTGGPGSFAQHRVFAPAGRTGYRLGPQGRLTHGDRTMGIRARKSPSLLDALADRYRAEGSNTSTSESVLVRPEAVR